MSEFEKHVALNDQPEEKTAAPPSQGAARTSQGEATPSKPAAAAPGQRGTDDGGGEHFDNFTPNTEAVLPEDSIEEGLDAASERLREDTARGAAGPQAGGGKGDDEGKAEGQATERGEAGARRPNGLLLCLGLAALVIGGLLVLRPRRRGA